MKNNAISLSKFLSRTLGVTGKDLTKIKHEEAISYFPELKQLSYDYVRKNIDNLKNIVYVDDGRQIIPYYCDYSIKSYRGLEIITKPKNEHKSTTEIIDYTSLSVYDLRCHLEQKFNSSYQRKQAKKELLQRGEYKVKKREKKKRGLVYEKY